jgi:hypothetical protein
MRVSNASKLWGLKHLMWSCPPPPPNFGGQPSLEVELVYTKLIYLPFLFNILYLLLHVLPDCAQCFDVMLLTCVRPQRIYVFDAGRLSVMLMIDHFNRLWSHLFSHHFEERRFGVQQEVWATLLWVFLQQGLFVMTLCWLMQKSK